MGLCCSTHMRLAPTALETQAQALKDDAEFRTALMHKISNKKLKTVPRLEISLNPLFLHRRRANSINE